MCVCGASKVVMKPFHKFMDSPFHYGKPLPRPIFTSTMDATVPDRALRFDASLLQIAGRECLELV